MAIERGQKSGTIKETERTWLVTISAPLGGVPTVQVHREVIRWLDGEVISRDRGIELDLRSLSQVAREDVMVGGQKLTAAMVAEAIAAFADKWREQDMARAAESAKQSEPPLEASPAK